MFRAAAAFAVVLILSSGALSAGVAGAQEAIPTARGVTPPDLSKEPPPPPLRPAAASNLAPVLPGPCGTGPVPKLAPVDENGEPAVDHSPHGEVSVGVGNHGMRYAEGSVCVPVGDHGSVAVNIGEGRMDGWRR